MTPHPVAQGRKMSIFIITVYNSHLIASIGTITTITRLFKHSHIYPKLKKSRNLPVYFGPLEGVFLRYTALRPLVFPFYASNPLQVLLKKKLLKHTEGRKIHIKCKDSDSDTDIVRTRYRTDRGGILTTWDPKHNKSAKKLLYRLDSSHCP